MTFAENEKVLCFHGPLMYEAKIIKAEYWGPGKEDGKSKPIGPHYNVHYKGWKTTWDEWVPEERLKKWNEENIQQQKALIDAQRARDNAERAAAARAEEGAKRAGAGGGVGIGGVGGSGSRGASGGKRDEKRAQKRGRDALDDEDSYSRRPEIKISIPDKLKSRLVDDWEYVTKNNMLVKLPRNPSVDVILEEWNKFHQNEEADFRRLNAEVSAGLRLYFNKALGSSLLYRFERGQYSEQLKKIDEAKEQLELSSVYGAEHLLRLFVNLPELLAHTTMDPDTVGILRMQMAAFLNWMVMNEHMLFKKEHYENTSSGYQNNNRP